MPVLVLVVSRIAVARDEGRTNTRNNETQIDRQKAETIRFPAVVSCERKQQGGSSTALAPLPEYPESCQMTIRRPKGMEKPDRIETPWPETGLSPPQEIELLKALIHELQIESSGLGANSGILAQVREKVLGLERTETTSIAYQQTVDTLQEWIGRLS